MQTILVCSLSINNVFAIVFTTINEGILMSDSKITSTHEKKGTLSLPKSVDRSSLRSQPTRGKVFSVPKENLNLARGRKKAKHKSEAKIKEAPPTLLNTWYWMWKFGQERSITLEGKKKLEAHFGTIESAIAYFGNESNEKN